MKKYILIIAVAIASLFAYSCTSGSIDREEAPVPAVKLVPLVLNSGVSVKTSLNSDGTVSWSDKDQIAVIDNVEYSEVRDFEAQSVEGSSATFVGSVADGTEQFYAVYPFGSVTAADKSSISVTLPASQNPTPGTFENNLNISVASGSKSPGVEEVNGVKFNNLCGLLRFTMPDELGSINKVSFTANRAIAGDLTITKATMNFTDVTGTVSTITKEGNFEKGSTFYFVITPGDIVGFSISVTTSDGIEFTKSSDKTIEIYAGQSKNLGVIPMVANDAYSGLSVAHTFENDVLTGTQVTFTPSVPEGVEFTAQLKKGNAVVRTLTSSVAGQITLPAEDGKPYLQQGDYTFTYSYTHNSVSYTKSQPLTVAMPSFAVSVSAETSYSLSRTDASTANADYAGAPMQSRHITASFSGISKAVLKQVGATYSASIANANSIATAENVKSLSHAFGTTTATALGSHTLTATCIFDGVTVTATAEEPCVITGLPHIAEPPKNSGNQAWSDNMSLGGFSMGIGVSWGGSSISITPDAESLGIAPSIFSPEFYSPGNLPVNIYVLSDLETKYKKKGLTGLNPAYEYVAKVVCSVGGTILGGKSGKTGLTDGNSYSAKTHTEKDVEINTAFSLTAGTSQITIYNNGSASMSQYPKVYVKKVELVY